MTSSPPGEALRVQGLSKRFRRNQALDGVDFAVPQASLTVLLGAAGAGKTTTLRLIAGLDQPDAGQVLLGGADAHRLEPRERNVAMIFDNLALYPDKTAFDNIASPLAIRRVPAAEIEVRVKAMAATLRISHLLGRLPKTMSGGERQRVALGRALVHKPGVCLLDEPLSSLDAMLRIELRAELRRLQRDLGYTFVLATPDFAEAMAVADSVVMLRAGRVVQCCDAQTLFDAPADREIARFVGAPEINLLPAVLDDGAAAACIGVAGARLPAPPELLRALAAGPREFDLGVRPEYLRLADVGRGSVDAALLDVEPLGLKSTLTVRNEKAEFRLVVDAHVANRLVPGRNLGIDFAAAPLLAFDRDSGRRLQADNRHMPCKEES
ncbi:ABC transporter ATP-binding protein [Rubrivivax gelatinosus]|nr:ABC transporter ATP-binding protein [Rubrivivax gelatinosus]